MANNIYKWKNNLIMKRVKSNEKNSEYFKIKGIRI